MDYNATLTKEQAYQQLKYYKNKRIAAKSDLLNLSFSELDRHDLIVNRICSHSEQIGHLKGVVNRRCPDESRYFKTA